MKGKKILGLMLAMALTIGAINVGVVKEAKAASDPDFSATPIQQCGELVVQAGDPTGINKDDSKLQTVNVNSSANIAPDKGLGSWGYKWTLNIPTKQRLNFRSLVDVFTYNFIGDIYFYLSSDSVSLGTKIASGFTNGTELDTNIVVKPGTYYLTVVVNKDGQSSGSSSDYTANPTIKLGVFKQEDYSNILDASSPSTPHTLQNGVATRVIVSDVPSGDIQYATITMPYKCNVTWKYKVVGFRGQTVGTSVDIRDLSGVSQDSFTTYSNEGNRTSYTLNSGTYLLVIQANQSCYIDIQPEFGESKEQLNKPVNINKPSNVSSNKSTASNKKATTATKFFPSKSLKVKGKNKITLKLSKKINGVKVVLKHKGKEYTKKTNKKGECTFKTKKTLKNKDKVSVTLSKKVYNTSKGTYKIITFSIWK